MPYTKHETLISDDLGGYLKNTATFCSIFALIGAFIVIFKQLILNTENHSIFFIRSVYFLGIFCTFFPLLFFFSVFLRTSSVDITNMYIKYPVRPPLHKKKNYKKIPLENILKVKIFNDYMFITTREKYYFSIRRKDLDDFEQFKKVLLNLLRKRTDASISDRRDIESLPEVD